ncbi:MAG: type IV secretion protein IcmL [Coxiella sp. (in: Bacteria)]|nr:MAG: type IV secretion protein IcmL [Coxiella sp. (in: g-proteobacteria)]
MKNVDTDKGLALVMQRNAFYRDAYRRVVFVLITLFITSCGLGMGIIYKYLNPPAPQYFATTAEGRIINIHKLSDPVVTDSYVTQWASNAVRQAFSADYIHWRNQLQNASTNFTSDGWNYFLAALKSSNNLNTLTTMKMVSSAELTAAPQITAKMVVSGHYAWKIKMPLLITYTDGKQHINMPWDVTVIVIRMPVKDYPQRIAINNFLPEVAH